MKLKPLPAIEPIVNVQERQAMVEKAVFLVLEFSTAADKHNVDITKRDALRLAYRPDIDFSWHYADSSRKTLIISAH